MLPCLQKKCTPFILHLEWYLLMINEEEEQPPPKNLLYSDLGPISLGDLESYIHKLESEIQRVRLEIEKKDTIKENATSVFKPRT